MQVDISGPNTLKQQLEEWTVALQLIKQLQRVNYGNV